MTDVMTPLRWDEQLGVHVVTGFAEANRILRSPGWSSDPRHSPFAPPEITLLPPSALLFMDPPDHTRLRRLVSPAFTPRAVEALRPRVQAVVEAALDQLEPGEADLLGEFGYVVPLAIIAELLDVGTEGAELVQAETPDLVRSLEIDADAEDLAAAAGAGLEITMFLTPLIAHRRTNPGEDFISALLAQPDITLDEVLATTILLLAAGHETTANLIANGALALLRDPAQEPALHADPPRAVEELLRLHGPVRMIARTALTEQDVEGHRVGAGDVVLIRVEDVNRDPRHVADPDRLDLAREPVPHLGFGAGAHFCLGAGLARLEAAEALPRLFARFPDLALADEPRWRDSTTFLALAELPVVVP